LKYLVTVSRLGGGGLRPALRAQNKNDRFFRAIFAKFVEGRYVKRENY
jgi:hypothetical protein